MIVFEEIKWKNFLSTGNSFTEVKIDDAPSHLILGSNGAGKSTLMRTIAALQDADSGTIMLGDVDVEKDKQGLREMLGYLPLGVWSVSQSVCN